MSPQTGQATTPMHKLSPHLPTQLILQTFGVARAPQTTATVLRVPRPSPIWLPQWTQYKSRLTCGTPLGGNVRGH
eukprot:6461780-Amphidinium_carterae.1